MADKGWHGAVKTTLAGCGPAWADQCAGGSGGCCAGDICQPGVTVKKRIVVSATRKAKGRATVTATSGKFSTRSNLAVKKACVKKKGKGSGGQVCGKTDHF